VRFPFGVGANGVLVGCRGVAEHTQDLMFGQETLIIQGKQQRLAYRKGCKSSVVGLDGHPGALSASDRIGSSCDLVRITTLLANAVW
jgi:hypothetical protein